MKRTVLATLLLTSFAFAQSTAAAAQGTAAPAQSSGAPKPADPTAQKARTLLNNMIKALGGDAYLNFTTMTQEGRTYSFYKGEPNSTGTLFWRFFRYPDKDRTEFTKKRDVIYVHNGNKGYEITFKGTAAEEKEVTEDYLRRRNHSIETVTREWLKDPGTIVLYLGTAVIDQKLTEQISIVNAKNDEVTISLDPNTFLPAARTFTFRDKEKYKVEDIEIYANYKNVQGIMTPHTFARRRDGLMVNQRFINTTTYNSPLADSLFDARETYNPFQRSGRREE